MKKFDLKQINSTYARERIQLALDYRRDIVNAINQQSGTVKKQLHKTATDIDIWIDQLFRLAKAIDTFDSNLILQRDRTKVPAELEALNSDLVKEADPIRRIKLEQDIEVRQRLHANLQSIEATRNKVVVELDANLDRMHKVYEMIQLLPKSK